MKFLDRKKESDYNGFHGSDFIGEEKREEQELLLRNNAKRVIVFISVMVSSFFLIVSACMLYMGIKDYFHLSGPEIEDSSAIEEIIADRDSIALIISNMKNFNQCPTLIYIDTIKHFKVTDDIPDIDWMSRICEVDTILCYDYSYKHNITDAPKNFRNLYITIRNNTITEMMFVTSVYSTKTLSMCDGQKSWTIHSPLFVILSLIVILQLPIFLLVMLFQSKQVIPLFERIQLQLQITAFLVVLVILCFSSLHLQFLLFVK